MSTIKVTIDHKADGATTPFHTAIGVNPKEMTPKLDAIQNKLENEEVTDLRQLAEEIQNNFTDAEILHLATCHALELCRPTNPMEELMRSLGRED